MTKWYVCVYCHMTFEMTDSDLFCCKDCEDKKKQLINKLLDRLQ